MLIDSPAGGQRDRISAAGVKDRQDAAERIVEAQAKDEADTEEPAHRGVDLTALFFRDVVAGKRLDREQEYRLAQDIVKHRHAIVRLLRGQRRLVQSALAGLGRGLVYPKDGFREREVLLVLQAARRRNAASPAHAERERRVRFARRLEAALARYRRARNQMITANIRLIIMIARRYRHPTLSLLDLIQEGTIGLVRAIEKFDPDRGVKFSTYAVWWIWQRIARAADCEGEMIRTPVHWGQMRRKMARALVGPEGGEQEHVASPASLRPEVLHSISQGLQCVSLATPVGQDGTEVLENMLHAPAVLQPENRVFGRELKTRLDAALSGLPEREARILRLRFGMDRDSGKTLDEIGSRFGVSRERIRQLEARALRQMRAICDREGLGEDFQ